MTPIEAMKCAVDALIYCNTAGINLKNVTEAITALTEAIEQMEKAKPIYQWTKIGSDIWHDSPKEIAYERVDEYYDARTVYTHPTSIPDDMVMLPRNLTKKMIDVIGGVEEVDDFDEDARSVYKAMIASWEKENGKC